jgi:AcrR family transcriptional regulator
MRKALSTKSAAKTTAINETSTTLMDTARTIFINEGVKGLSVRRLAEEAGYSTMAVYSRFKGKDGILEALYDEGFDQLAIAQQAVDLTLASKDRLLGLCRAYRVTAKSYPHHYALMMGQFSGELTPGPQSQLKAMSTLTCLIDAVAAMPSMRAKKRIASEQVANRLFAFCHGWVSLERMGFFAQDKPLDRQFDAAIVALLAESA